MPPLFRHLPMVVATGLCIALLHTACASSGARPTDGAPSPTVWSVRTPGGHLFLAGSVQTLPDQPLGPVLEWAFADAAELVFEVDYSSYDVVEGSRLADRYGRIAPPARLGDQLSPETNDLLEGWLSSRRLYPEPFERLQPWLAATAVSMLEAEASGLDAERGVDRILLERADGRKQVVGLESLESQLETLAGLPAGVQDLMLRDALARSDAYRRESRRRVEAWQRGDDDALERILFERLDDPAYAEFYERSVFERNQRMAERIAALSEDGRTRLVVVDATHMLGDRGIPALLGARGFEVTKAAAP